MDERKDHGGSEHPSNFTEAPTRKCRTQGSASRLIITPRSKPIISNDMSSSRRAINTPKDNKPGASIRTRTETSSTRSASCLPTVRPNRHDYAKNEHEHLIQQQPVVHYPRRPNNTYEAKITRSDTRSSTHRATKSRNGHRYVDAGCQTDESLAKAGSANKQPSLSREDVAKEFDFWI